MLLDQKFFMTTPANNLTKIECTFSSYCEHFIHWYQKKKGEPFKRVQSANIINEDHRNDHGFEFLQSEKTASNKIVLIIPNV